MTEVASLGAMPVSIPTPSSAAKEDNAMPMDVHQIRPDSTATKDTNSTDVDPGVDQDAGSEEALNQLDDIQIRARAELTGDVEDKEKAEEGVKDGEPTLRHTESDELENKTGHTSVSAGAAEIAGGVESKPSEQEILPKAPEQHPNSSVEETLPEAEADQVNAAKDSVPALEPEFEVEAKEIAPISTPAADAKPEPVPETATEAVAEPTNEEPSVKVEEGTAIPEVIAGAAPEDNSKEVEHASDALEEPVKADRPAAGVQAAGESVRIDESVTETPVIDEAPSAAQESIEVKADASAPALEPSAEEEIKPEALKDEEPVKDEPAATEEPATAEAPATVVEPVQAEATESAPAAVAVPEPAAPIEPTESEVKPQESEEVSKPEDVVVDDAPKESDEKSAEIEQPAVIEAPVTTEEPVLAESSAPESAPAVTADEPVESEAKAQAVEEHEVSKAVEEPTAAQESTIVDGAVQGETTEPAPVPVLIPEPSSVEPTESDVVQAEASEPAAVPVAVPESAAPIELAESEVKPQEAEKESKPEDVVVDDVPKESDEMPAEIEQPAVIEAPVTTEEPVLAESSAPEPVPAVTADELVEGEAKSQAVEEHEVSKAAEEPTAAQESTIVDGAVQGETTEPAPVPVLIPEPAAVEPTESDVVQAEASEPAPVPEPAAVESAEGDVKPQDTETEGKPEAEVASDLPEEAAKDEKTDEAEQSAPVELPVSEAKPQEIETSAASEPAAKAELETSVPPALPEKQVESAEDAAKKAYELAHAHENDEVNFDTPTDEELKAENLADVVPKSEGKEETEESATGATIDPEAKEEHSSIPPSSESGMESLTSISTETGDTPSVAPEEQAAFLIQEEKPQKESDEPEQEDTAKEPEEPAPEKVAETPNVEPEVVTAVQEDTGADVSEVQTTETTEPEAVAEEEPGEAATSAETTIESEITEQEETTVSSAAPESEAQKHEPTPLVDVASEGIPTVQSKEVKDAPAASPEESNVAAPSEKIDEVVVEPTADAPVESNTEVVAEVPAAEQVNEREEVPSAEGHVEDTAVVKEITELTAAEQDVPASDTVVTETHEEAPVVDTAKDTAEDMQAETEETDVIAPAPAETDSAAPETVFEQTPAKEVALSEGSYVEQFVEVTKEETTAEPIRETPGTQPTETGTGPAEAAEPVATETQEGVSVGVDTAQEVVERKTKAPEVPAEVEPTIPEAAAGEAAPSEEPAAEQPADVTESETAAEPLQEAPTIQPTETEIVTGEVAEPPSVVEESKPDDVPEVASELSENVQADTPTVAQVEEPGTITEEGGAAEPAATPATGRSAVPHGIGSNIARVDELLEEESGDLISSETPAVPTDEPVAAPELTVIENAEPEIQTPSVAAVEGPALKDTIPVTEETTAVPEVAHEPVPTTTDEASKSVESTEPVELVAAVAEEPLAKQVDSEPHAQPQAETEAGAVNPPGEQVAETAMGGEEAQEEVVPEVLIETPTPMSETLTLSSDEDDEEIDITLARRIAKAAGIPPEVIATLPEVSTAPLIEAGVAASEEDVVTPTEAKGESIPEEGEVKAEIPTIETQELETPTQSVLLERPEDDTVAASTGPSVDTDAKEVPERPKSPWAPSYSVITQGSSPVHPDEPIEETVTRKLVDISPEEIKLEKDDESVPTEPAVASPEVKGEEDSKSVPVAPTSDVQVSEPVSIEQGLSDAVTADITLLEETPGSVKDAGEQEPALAAEDREVKPSVEILAEEDAETPSEAVPANLSVDASLPEVPERPKSPWTPSYSVTKQGPGTTEPEELHLDTDGRTESKGYVVPSAEVQQVAAGEQAIPGQSDAAEESKPVIERPKSPYPPAYSVTQMGPGVLEETASEVKETDKLHDVSNDTVTQLNEYSPPSPVSENAVLSVADSNEPEPPLTPRSELGSVTPGFDSRSEVSESSHVPIPPSSPRTDPEVTSLLEGDAKTPLVGVSEGRGSPVSPLQTPLMSTDKELEALETPERLTESAVSGFDADMENSTTTGSWVKEANSETGSFVDASVSVSKDTASESAIQPATASEEPESLKDDISASIPEVLTAPEGSAQTKTAEETPEVPELTIPKLDVTAAPPAPPPVLVTNTFSMDSAYTQISDSLSPSLETGTNVTTPDVETMPESGLQAGSDIEPLEEETTSDQPWTSDSTVTQTPHGTQVKGKSLGVAHTLAMRSFPSAFAETDGPSTSEQPRQPPNADTLEVDDQLSELASRRRLESTVSSLAFPGGWVSSPSHKERASLEVAAGEFSRPAVGGNPISPILTPLGTEPVPEEKESKWRCVIM